jgi:hypothetical protein
MGPASTQRKDPVDALRYAMQMLGKGYADVVIVDLGRLGPPVIVRVLSPRIPKRQKGVQSNSSVSLDRVSDLTTMRCTENISIHFGRRGP